MLVSVGQSSARCARPTNAATCIVLIPFDRLVSDLDLLQSVSFSYVFSPSPRRNPRDVRTILIQLCLVRIMIIDEAHNIKNPVATRTLAMKSIKAECRFAMTGASHVIP